MVESLGFIGGDVARTGREHWGMRKYSKQKK
jgi:hypothetical protein